MYMKPIPDKIVLATKNQGKIKEMQDLTGHLPIELLALLDLEGIPDVIEDGETFEENALKKALNLAKATDLAALADDSGLCVNALDGRPGVYSARYAGEHATDEDRVKKLLEEMNDIPDSQRTAKFVCSIVLAWPNGENMKFQGVCAGQIIHEPRGSEGFGYDPVFLYEPYGLTFAEMDRNSKNKVSHRGQALRELVSYLEDRRRKTD
jgi:XTP/dITP diphosphohydrolase